MLVLRFGYCSQDFFLYFDRKRSFFACFVLLPLNLSYPACVLQQQLVLLLFQGPI